MAIRLSDSEVVALLEERKQLPANYRDLVQTRSKRGHKERELDLQGEQQSEFRLILRQSDFNPLDFRNTGVLHTAEQSGVQAPALQRQEP
jgi:hypothetical protein